MERDTGRAKGQVHQRGGQRPIASRLHREVPGKRRPL